MSQVVLITDGMETCHGDPAAEAEKLTQQFKNLRAVEVIGVGLNADEKQAVGLIARRGRGKYYDATSVNELKKAVAAAAAVPIDNQAAETVTNQGKKIVFPAGDIPFADPVVRFTPGDPAAPKSKHPKAGLGRPDRHSARCHCR